MGGMEIRDGIHRHLSHTAFWGSIGTTSFSHRNQNFDRLQNSSYKNLKVGDFEPQAKNNFQSHFKPQLNFQVASTVIFNHCLTQTWTKHENPHKRNFFKRFLSMLKLKNHTDNAAAKHQKRTTPFFHSRFRTWFNGASRAELAQKPAGLGRPLG